jgi:hypothetical protein
MDQFLSKSKPFELSNEYIKMVWEGGSGVAHAYNPIYSGGRDQEDAGLRPPLSKK